MTRNNKRRLGTGQGPPGAERLGDEPGFASGPRRPHPSRGCGVPQTPATRPPGRTTCCSWPGFFLESSGDDANDGCRGGVPRDVRAWNILSEDIETTRKTHDHRRPDDDLHNLQWLRQTSRRRCPQCSRSESCPRSEDGNCQSRSGLARPSIARAAKFHRRPDASFWNSCKPMKEVIGSCPTDSQWCSQAQGRWRSRLPISWEAKPGWPGSVLRPGTLASRPELCIPEAEYRPRPPGRIRREARGHSGLRCGRSGRLGVARIARIVYNDPLGPDGRAGRSRCRGATPLEG